MAKSNISPRQETEMPATYRFTRQCGAHRIGVIADWLWRGEYYSVRVMANGELFDVASAEDLAGINAIIGATFLELEMNAPAT
jgi:hypothetical protein